MEETKNLLVETEVDKNVADLYGFILRSFRGDLLMNDCYWNRASSLGAARHGLMQGH